jgi:hypothetical protein
MDHSAKDLTEDTRGMDEVEEQGDENDLQEIPY